VIDPKDPEELNELAGLILPELVGDVGIALVENPRALGNVLTGAPTTLALRSRLTDNFPT